ncbi:MAG: MurR/RpiR family transcriptional regulator, partial [Erysipelotrichaceae bacterium]|nr:MurR/RpiR family transcriptional regulator [Erysipelotrichaceae bacterium]
MDNFRVLYDLLVLVNKSRKETNDTIIAKAFIENRYDLDNLSLDQLSQKCYISQSALSRFIKKMGYKNYNEFKESMHVAMYAVNNDHEVISKEKQKKVEEIRDEVHDEIIQAMENMNDIDLDHLQRVIQTINQYQNIIFLGSELSMAMTHLLQMALINKGKNVYTIYELGYQKEILSKINHDTLIICISLEERWFKS